VRAEADYVHTSSPTYLYRPAYLQRPTLAVVKQPNRGRFCVPLPAFPAHWPRSGHPSRRRGKKPQNTTPGRHKGSKPVPRELESLRIDQVRLDFLPCFASRRSAVAPARASVRISWPARGTFLARFSTNPPRAIALRRHLSLHSYSSASHHRGILPNSSYRRLRIDTKSWPTLQRPRPLLFPQWSRPLKDQLPPRRNRRRSL
jgi:hypothetical protein